ncbi:MAG: molybdopterin-dependent oxidoreductase, partial [Chloroflexi bacterium]|nr:molybdopterin-dependent oxidoreductase [Chloroflexota bacterium]
MDDVVENAQAILIIGSNTTEQHPVFGAMIRQAVLKRSVGADGARNVVGADGARNVVGADGRPPLLVVADPRKIDITEFATLHLRQKPGTDVALINGLMHIILQKGW